MPWGNGSKKTLHAWRQLLPLFQGTVPGDRLERESCGAEPHLPTTTGMSSFGILLPFLCIALVCLPLGGVLMRATSRPGGARISLHGPTEDDWHGVVRRQCS